jgi:hypothetical protein
MAVIFVILIPVLAAFADDKSIKPNPGVAKSPSGVSSRNNTAYVPKLPEVKSPSINIPKSSFDVNKSNDTAHVPKQAGVKIPPKAEPKVETKTIMLPTWPVQVPARVPKNYQERPENPHAGENAGAAEGLGSSG